MMSRIRSMYLPASKRGRAGITNASITPEIVLWMPDCRNRYQIITPKKRKNIFCVTPNLPI